MSLRAVLLAALLCWVSPCLAQISVVSLSTTPAPSSSAVSSVSINRPAGVAEGDLLIAQVVARGADSVTITAPAGWTLVDRTNTLFFVAQAVYRRTVGALGSEPASYTWSVSPSQRAAVVVIALRGVDSASPVDAVLGTFESQGDTTIVATGITTTVADTLLLGMYSVDQGSASFSGPSGMTERADLATGSGSNGLAIALYTQARPTAGATGTRTATSSVDPDAAVGTLVALKPAIPAVAPPLYLRATGVPSGTLSTSAPTTVALANLDSGRDSDAGLMIKKGGSGAGESDATKYQRWLSPAGGATLSGTLQVRLWSAMKDFNTSKKGSVTAYLRDCNSSGSSCSTIDTATLTVNPWTSSGSWVQKTIDFGTVSYTVASGRTLELKLIVSDSSDDDMWFAYDTTTYTSVLGPPAAPAVDHYELHLPSASLSCLPSTVSVTACADSSSPCTSAATSVTGATATLATSAGTLGSSSLSFNASGVASTTLSHPHAADGSTVTVTLSGESTAASNARRCCADGSSCSAASSCTSSFASAGFIVAASAGGAAATLPAQTAGTASATHYLRAVKTSTTTKACEAALTGANTVDWALQCLDPSSCSSGNRMTLTGSSATAIASNPASGVGASTAVAMVFDANGNAPFSLNYADVGQVRLWASKSVNGAPLAGSSNAFVVKPAGFAIGAVQQAASPNLANPGATSAAGAKFVRAGESFGLSVTALTSSGATAPNFGRESSAEGVLLTPTLLQPAGGNAGTLANASIAGTSFSAGVASVANLAYSEVGIISLTPAVADGNYLGAGNVTGTASAAIGRFYPARFALSGGSVTHRSSRSCTPAATASYLGENFSLAFTLAAQNLAGATTQNYTGIFALFNPATAAALNLAGLDGSTAFSVAGGRLALGSASGSWSNGQAAVTLSAQALRAAAPDGPFNAAFGVAPQDSDGVALGTLDMASTSGGANDRGRITAVALRFARLRLANATGAADRALVLPLTAQYWNGSAWDIDTLDSCSTLPAGAASFGNLRGTLIAVDLAASPAVALAAGIGRLRLPAPGGGRRGSVDVALSLGSSAGDASCLQTWTPALAATSGANLAQLRSNWCGSSHDKDAAARASFGLPRTQGHLLHRRENF